MPSAARKHLSWEPGGSVELAEARKLVEGTLRGGAFIDDSAKFWSGRIAWHAGKVRTAAQGMSGKNMRQSALSFDMRAQRECTEKTRNPHFFPNLRIQGAFLA